MAADDQSHCNRLKVPICSPKRSRVNPSSHSSYTQTASKRSIEDPTKARRKPKDLQMQVGRLGGIVRGCRSLDLKNKMVSMGGHKEEISYSCCEKERAATHTLKSSLVTRSLD